MQAFEAAAEDVESAIRECGLFASVTGDALAELRDGFDGIRITTDEVLIREGDTAHEMYIVRHGRLRATIAGPDGTDVFVGEIGKYEVVGEMAVITDQDRSATIIAMRDTDLFRLPAEAFSRLIQRNPDMLRPFATVVVNRLRSAMTTPARPALPATIVFVPVDGDDLAPFVHELAGAVAGHDTVVLTSRDAEGRDNPAAWLLDVENSTELALLITDAEPTEWTRLCLRHADRINIVANEGSDPRLRSIETEPACRARFDQVPTHLIMRYRRRPSTTAWLAERAIASHVNVRTDSPADVARLARVITGTARILVLGGGGARGFAHLGVAQALREAALPIDGIIGTSAGAVVGGLLARFDDPIEGQRRMLDWFENARWRRDFNPPTVALMSGRIMSAGLQDFSGGYQIEELAIGFAAVSCDLVSAQPFVHDRGPLWQAVRASGSVPGLFPPLAIDGRLLVDGGLVANMPTEIARRRHPNAKLIAVDVGDPTDIDITGIDGSGIVNGWDRVRRRRSQGGASLAKVMMRLTELGRDDSVEYADVVISPDVRGFGLIETGRAAEIIRRGYEAGRRAVDDGLVD